MEFISVVTSKGTEKVRIDNRGKRYKIRWSPNGWYELFRIKDDAILFAYISVDDVIFEYIDRYGEVNIDLLDYSEAYGNHVF